MGAWLGAEFAVAITIGLLYEFAGFFLEWPDEIPVGLRLLTYVLALGGAILSITLVKRFLSSKTLDQSLPLPPPPPTF